LNLSGGGDLIFNGAGNVSRTIRKSMVVTTAVNANDVVIIDTANAGSGNDYCYANSPRVFGIATSTQAGTGVTQRHCDRGVFQVTATTAGAVAVGDFLAHQHDDPGGVAVTWKTPPITMS